MTPQWMLAIAMALTTAANTITATLKACNNVADTAEAYTAKYKRTALNELKLADLPDIEEDKE